MTMNINIKVDNPCIERKGFCSNCHSHFLAVRPIIKDAMVTKHFIKDLKDEEKINSLIKKILECSNADFNELHKFEENVDGNLIFRAKKEDLHIVYCINKKSQIIFLRAIKNFAEYKRFLEDKKQLKRMIQIF